MYGELSMIATKPAADSALNGSTMTGIGISPEGIQQNPVVYDLMFETSWRNGPINVSSWLDSYATRRYNVAGNRPASPAAQSAWRALYADVYSFSDRIPTSELTRPPSLIAGGSDSEVLGRRHGLGLARGWLQLQKAATHDLGVAIATTSLALMYDIVDVSTL